MRRFLFRIALAGAIAAAAGLIAVGVAHADNCSNAQDTQNCNAAINAVAWGAAVAAAGAAAAAGSALVNPPRTELTASGEEALKEKLEENCTEGISQLKNLGQELDKRIIYESMFENYLHGRREAYKKLASSYYRSDWANWIRSMSWRISLTAALTAASMAIASAIAAGTAASAAGATAGGVQMSGGGVSLGLSQRLYVWVLQFATKVPGAARIGLTSATPTWAANPAVGLSAATTPKSIASYGGRFIDWLRSGFWNTVQPGSAVSGTNFGPPTPEEYVGLQQLVDMNESFDEETDALTAQCDQRWEEIKLMVQSYRNLWDAWYAECESTEGERPTDPKYWEDKLPRLEMQFTTYTRIFGGRVPRSYQVNNRVITDDIERYQHRFPMDKKAFRNR